MDNFVVGNMAWNAGLVAITGFFIKKWMEKVDTSISDNRTERKQEIKEVKESIDKLADHVDIANGRTGKLETKIEKQIALCTERNNNEVCGRRNRRATDNKDA
jgi:hypothetical protein